MCGLVGVINNKTNGFNSAELDMFRDMLICDSVRGEDSTGVFGVNKFGNASMAKVASHPFNLVKSKEYDIWRTGMYGSGRIVVGHNRKATVGNITNSNAHPFQFGPVMLVHNGSINNFRSLLNHNERQKHGVEVDSHGAAVLLARHAPKDIIPQMTGAYAMIWYNVNEKKMYFIRNDERPLAFCKFRDHIFFASERNMIEWLVRRHYYAQKGEDFVFEYLKPHQLMEVNVTEDELTWHLTDLSPPPQPVSAPSAKSVISSIKAANASAPLEDIPEGKQFRIHYGYDEPVDGDIEYQQIIWTMQDFDKVGEPPAGSEKRSWIAKGMAHESEDITVKCHFLNMTEKEMDELGYADNLISRVRRVSIKDKIYDVIVYGAGTRAVDMIETGSGQKITKEHFDHMVETSQCYCGHLLKDMVREDAMACCFWSKGYYTKADGRKYSEVEMGTPVCKWCMDGENKIEEGCT